MESIVLRLRRHFQKEMETLRDQNVIFHRQVNQKIEAQMVEKNDFYNEISDFVRYDEFHVFQNRLNMIEQQMQNRSVSISQSDPSAESSEQEDEQLDEVGEILPNEAPPEDQEYLALFINIEKMKMKSLSPKRSLKELKLVKRMRPRSKIRMVMRK